MSWPRRPPRSGEQIREVIRSRSSADGQGCWIWGGSRNGSGYGNLSWTYQGAVQTGAHRISYIAHRGAVPDGLVIDHLCRVRACVNPQHMEVVESKENTFRSPVALGRINGTKTHCAKGHEYTAENTRLYRPPNRSTIARVCIACTHAGAA